MSIHLMIPGSSDAMDNLLARHLVSFEQLPESTTDKSATLLHKGLYIIALSLIKSQCLDHRLIIAPIEIRCTGSLSKMLISVPRRNTERITLLPFKLLPVDERVSRARNNMIYRGGSLTDRWRGRALVDPLSGAAQRFADCGTR